MKNATTTVLTDYDLIVATLYWKGSANRILTTEQRARAWEAGDGYGRMSLAELHELELVEDWSHIRDSSPEGIAAVAYSIRSSLGSRKLLAVQEIVNELGVRT
jgi:hypothetical protein